MTENNGRFLKIPLTLLAPLLTAAVAISGSLIASKVTAASHEERITNQAQLLKEARENIATLNQAYQAEIVHSQKIDDTLQRLEETIARLEDYLHMHPPPARGWERDPPVPAIPQ